MADTEGGTGEGVAVEQFGGQTEEFTEFTDFIFEEAVNGFDEFKFEIFGETADIVVAFDNAVGVSVEGDTLKDIG